MTTAKTTFNRATEENLVAYNRIITEVAELRESLIDRGLDLPVIDADEIIHQLTELKPYLFPEANKVNY